MWDGEPPQLPAAGTHRFLKGDPGGRKGQGHEHLALFVGSTEPAAWGGLYLSASCLTPPSRPVRLHGPGPTEKAPPRMPSLSQKR